MSQCLHIYPFSPLPPPASHSSHALQAIASSAVDDAGRLTSDQWEGRDEDSVALWGCGNFFELDHYVVSMADDDDGVGPDGVDHDEDDERAVVRELQDRAVSVFDDNVFMDLDRLAGSVPTGLMHKLPPCTSASMSASSSRTKGASCLCRCVPLCVCVYVCICPLSPVIFVLIVTHLPSSVPIRTPPPSFS